MDMNTPEQPRYIGTPMVMLEADKPTGEQPMELFITDEHTEHYLALEAGGDSDRGLLTGLFGWVALGMLCIEALLIFKGKWDGVPIGLIMVTTFFLYRFCGKFFDLYLCPFCLIAVPAKCTSINMAIFTTPRGMASQRSLMNFT